MSFNYCARRVRDPGRPQWWRLSSLRGCVSSFCWLTGSPYRETLERLGITWSRSTPSDPPTDEFLRTTLDALERERNRYLESMRHLERVRIRRKLRGNRQLSSAERAALAALRGSVDPQPAPAVAPAAPRTS